MRSFQNSPPLPKEVHQASVHAGNYVPHNLTPSIQESANPITPRTNMTQAQMTFSLYPTDGSVLGGAQKSKPLISLPPSKAIRLPPATTHSLPKHAILAAKFETPLAISAPRQTTAFSILAPATAPFTPSSVIAAMPTAHTNAKLSIYAYSYWRRGQSNTTPTFGGQYGASQTAIIGAYRLGGRLKPLSLLWRLSYTPSAPKQSELAIGARLQPFRNIPVSISVERRIQADGRGRFSGTIAGGKDSIALPARFQLAGFGQMGILSRGPTSQPGGLFYDASVKIDHAIIKGTSLDGAIGAGAWAGGQTGTNRFDIGPTVRATVRAGAIRMRIDADWRFRIKGAAQPGNGPALTLSTSF